MKKINILLFTILVFIGCDDSKEELLKSTLIYDFTINQKKWDRPRISAKIESKMEENFERREMIISLTSGDTTLEIKVKNYSWQNLPATGIITKTYYTTDSDWRDCLYENGKVYCEFASVTYISLNKFLYFSPLYEYEENTVTIFINDTKNRLLSGSVDVVCTNLDDEKIVVKGDFHNLKY
jgi:hypothetical protein